MFLEQAPLHHGAEGESDPQHRQVGVPEHREGDPGLEDRLREVDPGDSGIKSHQNYLHCFSRSN